MRHTAATSPTNPEDSMKTRTTLLPIAAIALTAIALAGCSSTTPSSSTTTASAITISVVRQLSAGDYYELWLQGAKAEAKKLGVTLTVSDANGKDAQQALDLQTAVNAKPDAIVVDHGFATTIDPGIAAAITAKIPVVAFDVDPGKNTVVTIDQSDSTIAKQVTGQLVKDTGGKAEVIYVYVAGYTPLDKRNAVWTKVKAANSGLKQVAQIGAVDSNTDAEVADQAKAALEANPNVTAILAPYDEFAKGATLAVNELGLQKKVKVYGADISTADIAVLTAANSPWVATSATDPANVGAVAIRAAYLKATHKSVAALIEVPPTLITQAALRSKKVATLTELLAAFPQLNTPDIAPVK
jgi:simple sugar transport system substrate-binding protein